MLIVDMGFDMGLSALPCKSSRGAQTLHPTPARDIVHPFLFMFRDAARS